MKFKNPFAKKVLKTSESQNGEASAASAEIDATSEPTEENQKNREPARIGWGWRSIYIFAAVSLVIYIIALISDSFADFFNRYPAAAVRAVLSYITYIFPFSLAEILLILLIPAAILVIILACRRYSDSWKSVMIFGAKLLSVVMILFSLFVWTLGTGYRGTELEDKLELGDEKVSAESLESTAQILIGLINETVASIEFDSENFAVMPYSYNEMSAKLMAAYDKICDKYEFIPRLYSRVKPVMMSELMSYTHITGIYTYFTGEANINVAFPDFTIPYTAAHELAHQRGMSREDEANFIAFLVCLESDDPYIRYSGYTNMLDYVLDAYYSADKSENHADYKELYTTLDEKVRAEQRAYYEFFQKYADNVAASVSGAVNDTFLQIQGTEGSISYGLVVDLTVKYYADQKD